MAPTRDRPVRAEVRLRREGKSAPRPAVDRVVEHLRGRGIEVSAVGAASLSIRCDRATFERVFETSLEDEPAPARPAIGTKDLGPLPAARFRARRSIVVPPEIRDAVEGVEFEPSPRFLG